MSITARFEINYLQCLDADGHLTDQAPMLAKDTAALIALFKQMIRVRRFDNKAIALQRTGKLGTYASCLGHEAAHIGIGSAMAREDVLAPSYREYGAQFVRGVRPREVLLYWGGDERGSDFSGPGHDFAWCVPIGTQCLHAAGAALAFKLRDESRVAVAMCGDGGSSKADTNAAINAAGAYNLPFVQCIINNQYAISVPRHAQTGAQTLAQKGIAGGLKCLQVDGNDIIAVYSAMTDALAQARDGKGGTVIEMITYRLSDHTTADDARRYRNQDEVEQAWLLEPLIRLRKYLISVDAWDQDEEDTWCQQCDQEMDEEINAYLLTAPQPVTAMFDYLYAQAPDDLIAQRADALRWENL